MKVSRAIAVLKHAKQFLPQYILKNFYISIIGQHFRYCSSFWRCCRTADTNRLQELQNRAIRIITNIAFDVPASPLLKNLGLRSVMELCEHEGNKDIHSEEYNHGIVSQLMLSVQHPWHYSNLICNWTVKIQKSSSSFVFRLVRYANFPPFLQLFSFLFYK